MSVGQVVWAPSIEGQQYLVFVGWPSDTRKLGIKYCYNRPCALYAVKAPSFKSESQVIRFVTSYELSHLIEFILFDENMNTIHVPCHACYFVFYIIIRSNGVVYIILSSDGADDLLIINLTQSISSAFFPHFRYSEWYLRINELH